MATAGQRVLGVADATVPGRVAVSMQLLLRCCRWTYATAGDVPSSSAPW